MPQGLGKEVVNAVLIREIGTNQNPVDLSLKALAGSKTRYQKIEKMKLAVMVAAKKLRRYFLAHSIIV
jgi:hypothetical protein